jgi:phosphatidylserine/phosphatidylglycerophosphate/cardiolipin synthase-like enzyme/uncharacterized membrane protein YdjX (TVP38/TMEM64 family)
MEMALKRADRMEPALELDAGPAICVPGRNCWRIEKANRAAFLIDADAYYHAIEAAFERAHRYILLAGWQLDSRFRLTRDRAASPLFGDFLHQLLRRNPKLNIYLLVWDFALVYATDREIIPLYSHPWRTHRRLHFLLDNSHPVGGSHHQKIVVIDDAVAFAGGLDIADRRWDTPEHAANDPRRVDVNDRPYPPTHDVQMIVDGDAAAALGDLVKDHWRRAAGRHFRTPSGRVGNPWPPHVEPELRNIRVAIARTEPKYNQWPEVREIEQLYLDSIRAAERVIYFENQYLSSQRIAEALAERLQQESGPEVIMVLPHETSEWLERVTMAVLRARLLTRLRAADRFNRLHVFYPVVPGTEHPLRIHAKLCVVDHRLVRIGSANLNNRSMGLDTECDLAIEATDDSTAETITGFRNRLLAEHLGTTPERVTAECRALGSLARAIEKLRGGERTLDPLEVTLSERLESLAPDSSLIDPERPLDSDQLVEEFWPGTMRRHAAPYFIRLALLLACLAALAIVWRSTPLVRILDPKALFTSVVEISNSPFAPIWVVGAYTLGSLIFIPITLLIIATAAAFGPVQAFFYSFFGSLLSSVVTYALGRFAGKELVYRLTGSVLGRVQRQITRHGFLSMLFARVVPLAPFAVVNIIAGACQIRAFDFFVATALGMIPGILSMVVLENQFERTVSDPALATVSFLVLMSIFFVGIAVLLSRWYVRKIRKRATHNR